MSSETENDTSGESETAHEKNEKGSPEGEIRVAREIAPIPETPTVQVPAKQVAAPKEEAPVAAAVEVPVAPSGEEELDEVRAAYPWYVVQTYSGYEQRVKLSLEERVRSHGMVQKFGRILVPQETVEEVVRGAKRQTKRKFFPGYILVQVALDDDSWHLVKETPKVSGFIGDSRKPSPLSKPEVETLLAQMEGGAKRPRLSKHFEEGDAVKVTDGPFAEFNGTVDEVKPDKGKLRVLISIFGRNTPVELDFAQVEKV